MAFRESARNAIRQFEGQMMNALEGGATVEELRGAKGEWKQTEDRLREKARQAVTPESGK